MSSALCLDLQSLPTHVSEVDQSGQHTAVYPCMQYTQIVDYIAQKHLSVLEVILHGIQNSLFMAT